MGEQVLGDVGTKKRFENDRVIVWEMRLEPAEKEFVHEHKNDFAGKRLEGEVANGNVLFAEKGGVEAAVNTGNEPFYEIIVELKD